MQPVAGMQASLVHGLSSIHVMGTPTHRPSKHRSSARHAFSSSRERSWFRKTQPRAGSQESSVHGLSSSQVTRHRTTFRRCRRRRHGRRRPQLRQHRFPQHHRCLQPLHIPRRHLVDRQSIVLQVPCPGLLASRDCRDSQGKVCLYGEPEREWEGLQRRSVCTRLDESRNRCTDPTPGGARANPALGRKLAASIISSISASPRGLPLV